MLDVESFLLGMSAGSGGSGVSTTDFKLVFIGEKTMALSEYTDTSTAEETDTGINFGDSGYALGVVTITCDAENLHTTTWAMSVIVFGMQTNGILGYSFSATQERGTAVLDSSLLSNSVIAASTYGVNIKSNVKNIILVRKANASGMTKIPAGNYTVKVYGISSV